MMNELPHEILGLQERAGLGDLAACHALGRCYADARGVKKDETEEQIFIKGLKLCSSPIWGRSRRIRQNKKR